MCGKRLNAWKTIPIRRRTLLMSTPRAVISSPSTRIRPRSIGSSRLTQRSSVDFPDPDAPIRQTTSCSATTRSTPRSTSSVPKDLCRPSTTSASLISCPLPGVGGGRGHEPVRETRERDGQRDEQNCCSDERRVVERRGRVDLRLLERLDRAEEADERRVLLQSDEVVEKRWNHAAHGLGQDDSAERLPVRQPERARSGILARMHRLDPGAIDLRHVRRVDEHERDDPPERRREWNPAQLQRRRAEPEQRDDEDRRHAAEEVCVGDAERAQREKHRPRQAANDCEERARRRG